MLIYTSDDQRRKTNMNRHLGSAGLISNSLVHVCEALCSHEDGHDQRMSGCYGTGTDHMNNNERVQRLIWLP